MGHQTSYLEIKKIKKFVIFFLLLAIPSFLYGADIKLTWDASKGQVDGYRLYISEDNGQTWTILKDNIPANTLEANVTVPDHKLVIIRAAAYNTYGESRPNGAGVFYNSDWKPPKEVQGLGVE